MHHREVMAHQPRPELGIVRVLESALVEINMAVSCEIVEVTDRFRSCRHSQQLHFAARGRISYQSLMKAAREFAGKGAVLPSALPVSIVQFPQPVQVFEGSIGRRCGRNAEAAESFIRLDGASDLL